MKNAFNLFNCNKLQNFSDPNSYDEQHVIKITDPDIHDTDGKPIEIFKDNILSTDFQYIFTIIEIYRCSLFNREYGMGQTLHTFTLLPGEETQLFIENTSTATTNTSSIFDSFNAASKQDFEDRVKENETNQEKNDELTQIGANVKGRGSYGVNSGKFSGEFNSTIQGSREAYAEKMKNALRTHASTQSASRTIEVKTSETATHTGQTESVQRNIKNYNKNRTLNFVFRQLTQRYVEIRHLIDVRIGVEKTWKDAGGANKYKMEADYPLALFDEFLHEYIIDDDNVKNKLKENTLKQLKFIDYKGDPYTLYEKVELTKNSPDSYYRFKRCYSKYDETELTECEKDKKQSDITSELSDSSDETCIEPIKVPGYILSVDAHMMKAEGVVVDTLLGSNDAYDDHILDLRKEELREMKLNNNLLEKMIEREKLAQEIVKNPDNSGCDCDEAVDRYRKVFCCKSSEHPIDECTIEETDE
ncbi:hypothetical protein [Bacillus paranthracis]|uniref:hypothetical protein n=1 Tax=Bacillus paranthracis TaxID=2026186 RepID=UPI002407BAB4|nr:hypothetical protein [Bacillus paranthracis]MDG0891836.1 hypothetical protein [Bacillus paranthracis]MDG0931509.1 hypothetical protein [Bacillus paranthracis]